MLCHFGHISDS